MSFLNLYSIRGRFLRADLIKYWKVVCDSVGCDLSVLFQKSLKQRTCGHRFFKLLMPHCNTDIRQWSFNVCCIHVWNKLPSRVVESGSLVTFKASLAEYLGDNLFDY